MLTRRSGNPSVILLVVCSVLVTSCTSRSQHERPESIGIITHSAGFPTVIRMNQTYILAVQARIYEGDIVETDEVSKLHIQMSDETVFSLGPNSHFVLHEFKYTPFTRAPIARLSLTDGTLRTQTANMMKERRSSFQIKTPLAVIDVTSGDFLIDYQQENTLQVAMATGTGILVSNNNGAVNIVEHRYGTTIIGHSAPQTPKIWPERRINDAFYSLGF